MMDFFGESFVLPDNFSYRTVEVSPEHTARPDLVSKALYGTTMYGDVICRINGIQNPMCRRRKTALGVPKRHGNPAPVCGSAAADLPSCPSQREDRLSLAASSAGTGKAGPVCPARSGCSEPLGVFCLSSELCEGGRPCPCRS